MSSSRKGDWIQTFTGKAFYPLDPRPEDVDLIDICHALSNICRYTGHVSQFYSVAQHSIIMALCCETPKLKIHALLHDAAEAYICDLARPVKKNLPGYKEIEENILSVIYKHFNIDLPNEEENKYIEYLDRVMLCKERRELLSKPPFEWTTNESYDHIHILNTYPISPNPSGILKDIYINYIHTCFMLCRVQLTDIQKLDFSTRLSLIEKQLINKTEHTL